MNIYLVQHLHLINDNEESVVIIGIFSSIEEATIAINIVNKKSGFRDSPALIDPMKDENIEGFYIDDYEINDIQWQDGYSVI